MAMDLGARRIEVACVQFHGWASRNRAALLPTREQVDAANHLGYDEPSWNKSVYAEIPEGYFDEFYFDELPSETQAAAAVLGYDQETWDEGEETDATDQDWEEMTSEQQEAAMKLGYDEDSW